MWSKLGLSAILILTAAAGTLKQQPESPQQPADLVARVTELEKRVAVLEQFHKTPPGTPMAETKAKKGEFLVPVEITNKRFHPMDILSGSIDEYVFWDSRYDFSKLEKPARAIKGTLEFHDLFDERKFGQTVTITDPVDAHGEHKALGTGCKYRPSLTTVARGCMQPT